jgi:spore maturation protein CgeB
VAANKKILISYWFGNKTIPLGYSIGDGFAELGYEVSYFNTWIESSIYRFFLKPASKLANKLGISAKAFENSPYGRERYRQRMFEKTAKKISPDVILVIQGHPIDKEILSNLRKINPNLVLLGWWVENPRENNEGLLSQYKLYDHYFCIHQFNYDLALPIKHLHAVGVDSKRYYRYEPPVARVNEIVFVGSWYPRREEYLSAIADLPLAIYGPIWEKKCKNPLLKEKIKARGVWGDALLDLYNKSQIVIDIPVWGNERQTLNLRTLDVPATGALLVTADTLVIREFMVPDEEVVTYTSPEDFREKILFYLENKEQQSCVAAHGYEKSKKLGSYKDKAEVMIGYIKIADDLSQ